ncbi:type II CRISPR RNA-guided endonuclease Cas9 [Marinilactibacillus psychrotolerans]|uniref:type II CRISPR RNA-guided endonuclease Cas9 n=1 Tax=Marinilactibacillus psychrotolerans TaxID=191770 RepID=UPI00388568E3
MSSFKNGYTLGLDIGVGSVGWGLLDEKRNIVDAGVRLFPEADGSNNETRRSIRGSRRLKRRRKHRLDRMKKLLKEQGLWPEDGKFDKQKSTIPYNLRKKGLYSYLTKEELAIALRHLGKRRGIHNVEVAEDESTEGASTKEQIKQNNQLLKENYVCEAQLILNEQEGQIRGLKNRFKTSDYVKEARKILSTQKEFYPKEITDEFIERYIELLEKRREYFQGPGKESPFGWYDEDPLKSQQKWFEKIMGRCSYFPDEFRSVKQSYSAQLFNVLNDLNNLSINRPENTKLTKEEKERIVSNVFKAPKGDPTLKKIAKEINIPEEEIKGFRVKGKNRTPEFTTLTIFKDISKITNKESIIENSELLDNIARICTIHQTPSHRKKKLLELSLPLSEDKVDKISELNYGGTHRLSLKMIKYLLPDLWETEKNQMELITENGMKPKDVDYAGKKYLPYDHVNEMILSPVVRRSLIQSIRVINAVIKQYGSPREIVIELARESNSKDKKKFLEKIQKENEALNKEIRAKLSASSQDKASKGVFNKLRLWHLQDGLCAYSLKPIKIEELLNNPSHYEIDHVIPRSVSFDDSMSNKVLVQLEENQRKGNRTPFQYMTSGNYKKFKRQVLSWEKAGRIKKKKREYLLEERDINKYDVQKEFINRNLVDTRYATREIMTMVRQFFVANEQDVKVKSINGGFTHYLRKLWDFPKDRGVDFKHHAEDALVVAMAGYIFEHKKEFAVQRKLLDDGKVVDKKTGEVLNADEFTSTFTEKWEKIKAIKNYKGYKYSHKVDMKPNRMMMKESFYSTRVYDNKEYVIRKHKLYTDDGKTLKEMILDEKKRERLLLYKHDSKTFEKLELIVKQYANEANPFLKWKEENEKYITKYSKKGNGPAIKSVKYHEHNTLPQSYHDASKNYKGNRKIVKTEIKPFRTDIYYENGKYKFLTVRYKQLLETKHGYKLLKESTTYKKGYFELMKEKGVQSVNNFEFSLYEGDIIELNGEKYKFIGTNKDQKNIVQLNNITNDYQVSERNKLKKELYLNKSKYTEATLKKKEKDINEKRFRIMKGVNTRTKSCVKIHTDVLGNEYKVPKENIKWKYPK